MTKRNNIMKKTYLWLFLGAPVVIAVGAAQSN
jgi:hypothetical protein